jgi:hypothetical protein
MIPQNLRFLKKILIIIVRGHRNKNYLLWLRPMAAICIILVVLSMPACLSFKLKADNRDTTNKEEGIQQKLLVQAADMACDDYNPSLIIQAVNALVPLGKEKALEEIESCMTAQNKQQEQTGLFWVLRVLFDVPEGTVFPPVRLGRPDIPPPGQCADTPPLPYRSGPGNTLPGNPRLFAGRISGACQRPCRLLPGIWNLTHTTNNCSCNDSWP